MEKNEINNNLIEKEQEPEAKVWYAIRVTFNREIIIYFVFLHLQQ